MVGLLHVVLKGSYLGEPIQLVVEVEMPEPLVELALRRILEEKGAAHLIQVVSGGLDALLKFERQIIFEFLKLLHLLLLSHSHFLVLWLLRKQSVKQILLSRRELPEELLLTLLHRGLSLVDGINLFFDFLRALLFTRRGIIEDKKLMVVTHLFLALLKRNQQSSFVEDS